MRCPRIQLTILLIALATALTLPTFGAEEAADGSPVSYTLPEGSTHEGDLNLFRQSALIAGTQKGDVNYFGQSLVVQGEIQGDVQAWSQALEIRGTVTESVRAFASVVTVTGVVQGDLWATAATITLAPGSKVTGHATLNGAQVQMGGEIGGNLTSTGGEIVLSGPVHGDASLKCDALRVESSTRISGDLHYTARNRLELDDKSAVGGVIDYEHHDVDVRTPLISGKKIFWRLFLFAAAFLGGCLVLRMSQPLLPWFRKALREDMLRTAGYGFIASVVFPVAVALTAILIITIPIVVIVFLLFGVAVLFLYQIPVALWLGESLARRLKRPLTSPYSALLLGLTVLHVLFLIPVITWLVYFAAVFLGMGALVLGTIEFRKARKAGTVPLAAPGTA